MLPSLRSLFLASVAIDGVLGDGGSKLKRGVFGPIATDSAASIAGGQIACGSPPVSSFFEGLNPPV